MIDQSALDLLTVIGGAFTRVAGTNGGEYAGACPFCGGRDRFRVWPHATPPRWWCRQCERHGDAVAFVQQREGVRFDAAVRMLGLQGPARPYRGAVAAPPAHPPVSDDPPSAAWQAAAEAFVEASQAQLRGPYRKPLEWLLQRGYRTETLTAARIGYHPGSGVQGDQHVVPRSTWGLPDDPPARPGGAPRTMLWLPRGIVIPWYVDGVLWKVFVRRPIPPDAWEAVRSLPSATPAPSEQAALVVRCLRAQRSYLTVRALARQCGLSHAAVQAALTALQAAKWVQRPTKHYQVPGGSNSIYHADTVQPGRPVVLVEAALDALAIQQAAGDRCAAVATGTTGGRSVRWCARIVPATPVLLAYDNDQGGNAPRTYWQAVLGPKAFVWRPYLDDPAAMVAHGMDVRGWIEAGLAAAAAASSETVRPADGQAALDRAIDQALRRGDLAQARHLAQGHRDAAGALAYVAMYAALNGGPPDDAAA